MIKRNFQTLIFKKKKSSLIIIPTIKTLPTTNISSQNRKYGAQKSSKKTDTNKKSSSSSNTKTTSSGAGGSMIPGSQQFHITDKRYEVIKQILYETEKPDLSSLTQEDLERHETIERAWKLFCRHQKEQKELELARKYRMLNEANIELEKVDERLFKEAQLNNSKILFPGKMKIPTETPPLDGWNYNYTKPITTTIVNKDNEVVDEVDDLKMNSFIETNNNNNNNLNLNNLNLKSINSESIKLQNNDKENKENQNDDNDILKDGSDINQQKLNDESNQDLKACALYDFLAENTSELSFQEGDILTINYRQCVGWLVAELDGKCFIYKQGLKR
ncbi:6022_t:CDS:2 [Entrophospora sp. SA101]|nr:6022_t:CDS:2 [Entrophospora sp. SA101]